MGLKRSNFRTAMMVLVAVALVTTVTGQQASAELCIPADVRIDSATFWIYAGDATAQTVRLHRVTADWDEATVTWNSFGGSYDAAVAGSFVADSVGWKSVDVTALVQAWLDVTYPNNGLLLEQGEGDFTRYASSEYGDAALRPQLEVCIGGVCQMIQRPGAVHEAVADAFIGALIPDGNYGDAALLTTGLAADSGKQSLVKFDICDEPPPECTLEVTKTCFVAPPSGGDDCKGKVVSMVLEYTGLGCAASNNTQDAKKVSCEGDAAGTEPVDILVTDKKKDDQVYADVTGISVGDSVLAAAANAGKTEFAGDTRVRIFDSATGALLEELTFHTSCSQPLNVGDQFGSMTLTELTTTEGGDPAPPEPPDITSECVVIAPGEVVEYTYVVTNTGDTPVTNISVIDDVIGEVNGSPIAVLAPLDSVALVDNGFVAEETTNTVTVEGYADIAVCRATASAIVTVEEPPAEPCTTKVQAMLLTYIGPAIGGPVTVTFIADKFKEDPVIYSFPGGLATGTLMLDAAVPENGWTIDANAHLTSRIELGAKTSILINGVEEVIHTSCSAPFVAGAPAPLDNPKGDPSPNWFVEDFIQK